MHVLVYTLVNNLQQIGMLLCDFTPVFKLPEFVVTSLSDVTEPNIKVLAHSVGTHAMWFSTPKSQACQCVVEIPQTFQQGPSQLHCVFSIAFCHQVP